MNNIKIVLAHIPFHFFFWRSRKLQQTSLCEVRQRSILLVILLYYTVKQMPSPSLICIKQWL